jgi:F-type H+-transporting ATPase subunit a
MGEHDTWYDLLYGLPAWENLSASVKHTLGRTPGDANHWEWMMFGPSHWTISHVLGGLLVLLFVAWGALRFHAAMRAKDALVPPRGFGLRNVFELLTEATFNMMAGVMGEKNAKRFLPLIGTLALFILFSNLLALIPGFAPPTDTLKTNLALAVVVFLATHYYGIKEHGLKYFKHFLGPIAVLAPLMLLIELISHIARPVSLSLRLMGNMASDHKVVAAFFALVPVLVPVPFLVLGILVSVVQTLVFCLLSTVYIAMAVAHDH